MTTGPAIHAADQAAADTITIDTTRIREKRDIDRGPRCYFPTSKLMTPPWPGPMKSVNP